MKQIWKFPVPIKDTFEIEMPPGAKILTVQTQNGIAMMWAICEPLAKKETRYFSTTGTGHLFNFNNHYYIGTFQIENGALVFHVFEFKP